MYIYLIRRNSGYRLYLETSRWEEALLARMCYLVFRALVIWNGKFPWPVSWNFVCILFWTSALHSVLVLFSMVGWLYNPKKSLCAFGFIPGHKAPAHITVFRQNIIPPHHPYQSSFFGNQGTNQGNKGWQYTSEPLPAWWELADIALAASQQKVSTNIKVKSNPLASSVFHAVQEL